MPYRDLLCIDNSSMFFIYLGFSLASLAFLTQYLTFPKSLLSDLSNLRVLGFPRIIEGNIGSTFPVELRNVVSYFFQLDYVTYALLMFILYSDLIILTLTSIHFKVITSNPNCIIYILTIIYLIIRGVLVYRGALLKIEDRDGKKYKRGEKYWTKGERWCLIITEIIVTLILIAGIMITVQKERGFILFLWMVLLLIIMFAWHLTITAKVSPVSRLLAIWTGIADNNIREEQIREDTAEDENDVEQ